MFRKIGFIVGCLACGMCIFSACSIHDLSDAKQIVAQADSVGAEGGMYSDSLSLAQAYETLSSFNYPLLSTLNSQLSTDFVHACYHYGKLLRAKDDPVAAMQVFINATHAGSGDKQILGRIYNNMGDICHRASEFDLSYDMFKRSADVFLCDKDTLSYYYCLNDMALELAEQGKKEETYTILDNIIINCKDRDIYLKTIETRAVACKKVHQYDSTIYYTSLSFKYGCYDQNILINRAQAYSLMGFKDSAVYYATHVLSGSNEPFGRNNALYILTNDDKTKNIDEVRETAAERSDTQKLIETSRSKHAQAVQLLEQDINRKPSFTWLYAILITLLFIGTGIFIYVHKKKKRHQLLSQQIEDLESKNQDILSQRRKQIEAKCMMLANSSNIKETFCWNDFEMLCKNVDTHFYMLAEKLRQKHILNEQEIRLCILVLLNISRNQIAEILLYAPNGVGKFKYRVAQKFQVEGKNLRNYMICLAIDEPYK